MTMNDDNNTVISMTGKDIENNVDITSVQGEAPDKVMIDGHDGDKISSTDNDNHSKSTFSSKEAENEKSTTADSVKDSNNDIFSEQSAVLSDVDATFDIEDPGEAEPPLQKDTINSDNDIEERDGDALLRNAKRNSANQPLTAELLAEQNELFSKKTELELKPNSIRAWAAELPDVPDTVQPILRSTHIFEMDSLTLEDEDDAEMTGEGLEADKEQHRIQETKDIFSDTQKIAYVGLCYLTSLEVVYDFEGKDFTYARMSADNWQRKLMRMLYMHMDISKEEIKMIESLSKHDILPTDLVHQFTSQGETTEVELDNINTKKQQKSEQKSEATSEQTEAEDQKNEEEQQLTDKHEEIVDSASLKDNKIIVDLRWTVMCDLFLLCLSTENYDARSRVFIARVASHLSLDWFQVIGFEKRIAEQLLEDAANSSSGWETESITTVATNMTTMTTNTMTMTDIDPASTSTAVRNDVEKTARNKQRKKKRVVMIGLATIGGGLILGLSAGLMAPVIAGGIGAILTTVGVTGSGAFLGSTTGIALITGGATLAGGRMGAKGMSKRTKQIQTFEFVPIQVDENVNCIISITGWLPNQEKDESALPFSTLDPLMGDHYHLYWEPEMLEALGSAFKIFATEAVTFSIQQALAHTIMGTLLAGLAWPLALTKLGYMVDNPWANALDRSRQAGLILADTLMNRNLGARPVTLVGYSLGARVIFFCLLELARMKAFGLVENVALFGTPVSASKAQWKECTTIVSGRFINGYATNDWLLGFLFRTSTAGLGNIAGLRPLLHIEGNRVQNLDCTDLVNGHLTYRAAMPKLLKRAGFVVTSEELPLSEKEKAKSEDSSVKNKNLKSATASLKKSDSMASLSSANTSKVDEITPSPSRTSTSLSSVLNNNNSTTDTTLNNTNATSDYDIIADILASATAAASSKAGTYSSLSSGKASIATTPSISTDQHYQQQSMTRSSSSTSTTQPSTTKRSFFSLRFNKSDPTINENQTTITPFVVNDTTTHQNSVTSSTATSTSTTTTTSRFITGAASIFNLRKKQETEEEKELREAGVPVKEIKGTLGTLVVPKEVANPMPQVKLEAPQFARLNK